VYKKEILGVKGRKEGRKERKVEGKKNFCFTTGDYH
jgi:hypothetical protein